LSRANSGFFVPDVLAKQADLCFSLILHVIGTRQEGGSGSDAGADKALQLQCLEERSVLAYLRLQWCSEREHRRELYQKETAENEPWAQEQATKAKTEAEAQATALDALPDGPAKLAAQRRYEAACKDAEAKRAHAESLKSRLDAEEENLIHHGLECIRLAKELAPRPAADTIPAVSSPEKLANSGCNGALGCSRCRFAANGCSQCRDGDAPVQEKQEPFPGWFLAYLEARFLEKQDPVSPARFLPLYSMAWALVQDAPKRVKAEVLYRMHASRLGLAQEAGPKAPSKETLACLAEHAFYPPEATATSVGMDGAGGMDVDEKPKPGRPPKAGRPPKVQPQHPGPAPSSEAGGVPMEADPAADPSSRAGVVDNAIAAMRWCRQQDRFHHKSVFRTAEALYLRHHEAPETPEGQAVIETAKRELRALFEKANKFSVQMFLPGTNGGEPNARCEPDDGIFALQGRVSKYHKHELRLLQLYLSLCEETGDFSTLAEGCGYFRSRGHYLHPEFLFRAVGTLGKTDLEGMESGQLLRMLKTLYDLLHSEDTMLTSLGIHGQARDLLCAVYPRVPPPEPPQPPPAEPGAEPEAEAVVVPPVAVGGEESFEEIMVACKERFKSKRAKKAAGPKGPKGRKNVPDYLRKPKLTTKRQRMAAEPKQVPWSQGGPKPDTWSFKKPGAKGGEGQAEGEEDEEDEEGEEEQDLDGLEDLGGALLGEEANSPEKDLAAALAGADSRDSPPQGGGLGGMASP